MRFPSSFSSNRASLLASIHSLSCISLNSYETATPVSSANGAMLVAKALQDITRQFRPSNWNAVVLYVIANKPEELAEQLKIFVELCPLSSFVKAQNFASSISTIEQDKFAQKTGYEQSIEWQKMNDCLSLPVLKNAFNDASLSLVSDESKAAISDIDAALSECQSLKANRDARLTEKQFVEVSTNVKAKSFNANSARGLAHSIKTLGDNSLHWAYVVFVGSNDQLKPIKELFL